MTPRVDHLKHGDLAELVFEGDVRVTCRLYQDTFGILLAGDRGVLAVRDRSGSPNFKLVEVISPKPPEPDPLPFGEIRKQGTKIAVNIHRIEGHPRPWMTIDLAPDVKRNWWSTDDDVRDWTVIPTELRSGSDRPVTSDSDSFAERLRAQLADRKDRA